MVRKPQVTIVGPGRLGTALTVALHNAGYRIDEIVSRSTSKRGLAKLGKRVQAKAVTGKAARFAADVVWICVPDTTIAEVARRLAARAHWEGKYVFHSSGALSSAELSELRSRGALTASVHPMMSFVHHATPSLAGVSFAIEGNTQAVRMARRIVKDLGGEVIRIATNKKPLYHAFGAFASPMLISTLAVAEQVGRAAGLSSSDARRAMLPIVAQTIRNYADHGAAGAFSGPIIRGDAETVRKNLASLKRLPEAQRVYVALARAALRHLPTANRKKLEQALRHSKR